MRALNIRWLKIFTLCATVIAAVSVQATTINFDDIYAPPIEDDCFCPYPLQGDEYLSQGLHINNGFYSGGGTPSAPSNALGGFGGGLWLAFVGKLPTHFEAYVNTAFDQATFFDVYDKTGALVFTTRTDGEVGLGGDNTPYVPNQLMKIDFASGISGITINAAYGLRVGAFVDDVTFAYGVPEPSSWLLFAIGLLPVFLRGRRNTRLC